MGQRRGTDPVSAPGQAEPPWAAPSTSGKGNEDAATKLAEIRRVLSAFDWERDDRQYALEEIERIVTGEVA